MSKKPRAIVLLSGGMDSCVTLAIAALEHEAFILHAIYGQRTARRERKAFQEIGEHYDIPSDRSLVIDLSHLGNIGGSALTEHRISVPDADPGSTRIPITYVPFRNANLLAAAASWAEVTGAGTIFMGAVEADSSGYPDCRREFFDSFEQAIDKGTRPETTITIVTPVIHMTKSEIVRRGGALDAPLHLTWSCYQNEDVPCGVCDSCVLRAQAFEEAGLPDRI